MQCYINYCIFQKIGKKGLGGEASSLILGVSEPQEAVNGKLMGI